MAGGAAQSRGGDGESSPRGQLGLHHVKSGHSGAGTSLGGALQVWGEHHGPRKSWGMWNLRSGVCPAHGDQVETQAAAM